MSFLLVDWILLWPSSSNILSSSLLSELLSMSLFFESLFSDSESPSAELLLPSLLLFIVTAELWNIFYVEFNSLNTNLLSCSNSYIRYAFNNRDIPKFSVNLIAISYDSNVICSTSRLSTSSKFDTENKPLSILCFCCYGKSIF